MAVGLTLLPDEQVLPHQVRLDAPEGQKHQELAQWRAAVETVAMDYFQVRLVKQSHDLPPSEEAEMADIHQPPSRRTASGRESGRG